MHGEKDRTLELFDAFKVSAFMAIFRGAGTSRTREDKPEAPFVDAIIATQDGPDDRKRFIAWLSLVKIPSERERLREHWHKRKSKKYRKFIKKRVNTLRDCQSAIDGAGYEHR